MNPIDSLKVVDQAPLWINPINAFYILIVVTYILLIIATVKILRNNSYRDKFLSKLSSLLEEKNKPIWSSKRFQFMLLTVLTDISFWFIYTILCLANWAVLDIPFSVASFVIAMNGISVAGFLKSKKLENEEANKTSN